MSSAMLMALNHAPLARPITKFYPSFQERHSFAKSTTSKKPKRVVTMALENFSPSAINKFDAPVPRKSSKFHPCIWGDIFLAYEDMEPFPEEQTLELKQLREDIIAMLRRTSDGSSIKLELIDDIQRLGISYLFEDEIEASMSNIYNSYDVETQDDLHSVALRFCLLRHQGHHVSSDVFKKFQNQEGKFDKAALAKDVRGVLSLYEASHYSIHGEDILDESLTFTTATLEAMVEKASGLVAIKINQALRWPIRKTLHRVMAREYISLYQQDQSHDEVLLRFAKLDFNRVQILHQQELCALTKWWKDIDCPKNYPFVRNRNVENYFVCLALYFEPQYSLARMILTKLNNVITIIDDIYDAYGTIDELLLLTDAIQRWEIDAVNQLPTYMRLSYKFLLEFYTQMQEELVKYGMSERLEYAKAEIKYFAKLCYKEAYWNHTRYQATFEQYMVEGIPFGGLRMFTVMSYMGMGDLVTKAVLDWGVTDPLAIRAGATICKLTDDKWDYKDSAHATAVEYYMNQHDASSEKAIEEIEKQISHSWKDLNQECLLPTAMPMAIMERPLNVGRMIFTTFKDGDNYTDPNTSTNEMIRSIMIDPIIL